MKTIKIKVYQFDELSDEAKEFAHKKHNDSTIEFFWTDDWIASLKKGIAHFGFKLANYNIDTLSAARSDLTIKSQYNQEEEELSGDRLWTYLHNAQLLTYICQYDRIRKNLLDGNCPFTGYCGDEDFLDPVREFIEKPTSSTTFKDLIEACAEKLLQGLQNDCEYQQSLEFFKEECESNDTYFTEDGTVFT
jgi:hypothetical protein